MILAAGMGKRLGNDERIISKPLLEVAGKSLIQYMIEFTRSLGVGDLIVVGGFKYETLEAVVKKNDSKVILARNNRYELQNLVSFKTGLDKAADDDLFVCNADYIFMPHTIEAIKESPRELAVYASYDTSEDSTDAMKVRTDQNNKLLEMSKQLTEFQAIYSGMFFIPKELIPEVRKIVDDLMATEDLAKASVEVIFKALMNTGHTISVDDVGKPDWFEIDTVEEWEVAKRALEK